MNNIVERNDLQTDDRRRQRMDEQNNYQQYYQQKPSQKPAGKPKRRFLRIWGPFLLKLLIVYVVSCTFVAVLMGQYFESTIGLETPVIAEYMAVEENYYNVLNEVMNRAAPYTTFMEGLAALITIPFMLLMFHRDRVRDKINGVVEMKKAELTIFSLLVIWHH